MRKTTFGLGASLELPYGAAIQRVKEALKAERFGVLAEINVRKTMRAKPGVKMGPFQRGSPSRCYSPGRSTSLKPLLLRCCAWWGCI